ncbi:S8 family serine peptidase [Arthrobacter sp. JZ12]|uniref:S8 family serine peptidase n=1 Tax=Arthrobacter sp. JZ12 TaxID=2654190 RepID=UPI002B489BEC|nr:S8 family serine peptidase [Arthrobacter sp. JZ12]
MKMTKRLTLSLALVGLLGTTFTPAEASTIPELEGATLSASVQEFLSSADDSMQVIVTFDDRSGLDALKALDPQVQTTRTLSMGLATLTADQIRDIASWGTTRSIWENATDDLYLEDSIGMINADDVWAGEGLRGTYDGTGVTVAVTDTGVDATHPDLTHGNKVIKNFAVVGDPLSDTNVAFVDNPTTADDHGHGTHVSGTIGGTGAASEGKFRGVAPASDIISFKLGSANVLAWWAIQSYDWILTEGDEHNVRVVSNSWGGGGGSDYDPEDPVNIATKAAYDAGVVTVFAAGNSGSPNTMGRNSVSPYVVSVAAANKDFTLASFSSTGRPDGNQNRNSSEGLYRPTLTAPGVDIGAARALTGAQMSSGVITENPFYTRASGTSMATPHVSGVVALMLEANPALTPANVISILECSAAEMPGYASFEVGAGMLDAQAAVAMAEKGRTTCKSSLSVNGFEPIGEEQPISGTVLPGGYAVDTGVSEIDDAFWRYHKIEVTEGMDALHTQIAWNNPAENIYLHLYDPQGNEVGASAGLLAAPITEREVLVTYPEPGTWTVGVVGRVNAVTPYTGTIQAFTEASTKPGNGK